MIKEEVVKTTSGLKEMKNANATSSALAKAVTHHLAGQSENALTDLDIALDGANRTAEVLAARGYLQLELGRFEDAWESYSKALEMDPRDPQISFNSGIALQNLGRTARSHPAF